MVSTDHFRQELLAQMNRAAKGGLMDVLISSGELYPHGMRSCSQAMQAEMKPGDTLLVERANGAGMTVRYLLPRAT